MSNPRQPGLRPHTPFPLAQPMATLPPTPPHSIATQLKPRPGSACVLTPFLLRSAYGLTLHPTVEPIIHSHENEKRFTTKGDAEILNLETT